MEYVEALQDIHFLLDLPNYINSKKKELDSLYDDIQAPIMFVDDLGQATSNALPVDLQAIELISKRSRIEKQILYSVDKGRNLVKSIKELTEDEQEELVNGLNNHLQVDTDILIKFRCIYTKIKNKQLDKREKERKNKYIEYLKGGVESEGTRKKPTRKI